MPTTKKGEKKIARGATGISHHNELGRFLWGQKAFREKEGVVVQKEDRRNRAKKKIREGEKVELSSHRLPRG